MVNRTRPHINSIAVLPFTNISGDPNLEYLGDGIGSTVTASLSQLNGLRVMASDSVYAYKGLFHLLAAIASVPFLSCLDSAFTEVRLLFLSRAVQSSGPKMNLKDIFIDAG